MPRPPGYYPFMPAFPGIPVPPVVLAGYSYLRAVSKRALKKYVAEVPKKELELQVLDLYERFPAVKRYYNFVFNPREEEMVQEAKAKIKNEYFPTKRKRPRARRSVAQKIIKQYRSLGMDPSWVAELMIFNLETAVAFEVGRRVPEAFFKSMSNSFSEMTQFVSTHQLLIQFKPRILLIYRAVLEAKWPQTTEFSRALDVLD